MARRPREYSDDPSGPGLLYAALRNVDASDVRRFALLTPRHDFVSALAGTSARRTQQYRSVARRVQRWAKGGGFRLASRDELLEASRGWRYTVDMTAFIVVSPPDERERHIRVKLTAEQSRRVIAAHRAGDRARAWRMFVAFVLRKYGVPAGTVVTDVIDLDVFIAAGGEE